MITMRRPHSMSIQLLIFLALLVAVPGHVLALGRSVEMPKNASATRYGSGWECDRGYREAKGACIAVKVPANAYPTDTPYGRAWECRRGYQETDEACVAIKVPSNAYLNATARDGWTCDRGYRPLDGACVAIKVPQNGYLMDASYGPGWACDRGYREDGEACVAIKVAHSGRPGA